MRFAGRAFWATLVAATSRRNARSCLGRSILNCRSAFALIPYTR